MLPRWLSVEYRNIVPLKIDLRPRDSDRMSLLSIPLPKPLIRVSFQWFQDELIHSSAPKAVYKGETLAYLFWGASRPKDGKDRMNKSVAKKMKQRSAGKPDIELGKRIRLRRVEQRISQAELGDQLGVSFQQVQKYEKGVNRVGAARLQQIATALDVPVTFFYDGDGKAREVESLLFLDSAFSLRLLRAYSKIKDQTVQRQLVSLMESIAANED